MASDPLLERAQELVSVPPLRGGLLLVHEQIHLLHKKIAAFAREEIARELEAQASAIDDERAWLETANGGAVDTRTIHSMGALHGMARILRARAAALRGGPDGE